MLLHINRALASLLVSYRFGMLFLSPIFPYLLVGIFSPVEPFLNFVLPLYLTKKHSCVFVNIFYNSLGRIKYGKIINLEGLYNNFNHCMFSSQASPFVHPIVQLGLQSINQPFLLPGFLFYLDIKVLLDTLCVNKFS